MAARSSRTGVEAALLHAQASLPVHDLRGASRHLRPCSGARRLLGLDAVWTSGRCSAPSSGFIQQSPRPTRLSMPSAPSGAAHTRREGCRGDPDRAACMGGLSRRGDHPTGPTPSRRSSASHSASGCSSRRGATRRRITSTPRAGPTARLAIADLVQPHAIEIPAGDPNLQLAGRDRLARRRRPRALSAGFMAIRCGPRPPTISLPKFRDNAGGILSPAATDGVVAATLGLGKPRTCAA